MTLFFLDSSALARRYVPEVGSAWVRKLVAPAAANTILISALATVEIPAVLARRQREGFAAETVMDRIRTAFLVHVERQYVTVTLTNDVLRQARHLVARYPLRTLDAIQLACALVAREAYGTPPAFVCADRRLLQAASTEGFATDDPNRHL